MGASTRAFISISKFILQQKLYTNNPRVHLLPLNHCLLWANRGALNPKGSYGAWGHVSSQDSFGRPLRVSGIYGTQSDHTPMDLL